MTPAKASADTRVAWVLFGALAVLYWTLRCRSFGPGDSPQHVLSALTWGVSIAPGYPLYVQLGHLISRLPGGGAAAVNGLSGLLHAATASILYLLLRGQGLKAVPSLLACALMAFSPLFWYYSEIAEVRALNDLLAVAAAYVASRWLETRRSRDLYAFAALVGLGIGHHPTFVLIFPALAFLFFSKRAFSTPTDAVKVVLIAVGACVAPFFILWLRLQLGEAVYNPAETKTWGQVLGLLTRKDIGGPLRMVVGSGIFGFGDFDLARFFQQAFWYLASAARELTFPGLALAAGGAIVLARGARKILGFWLAWTVASAFVFIAISSQQLILCDEDYVRALVMRFYLLPHIGLFALAGFGAGWLLERVRPVFGAVLLAAAILGPLAFHRMDLRGHGLTLDYARRLIASSAPKDLVVLGPDDTIFAMAYLERAERSTEDRVFLVPSLFSYPPYIRSLSRRHPGLKIPPLEGGALTTDWLKWLDRNPGRRLLAEGVFRDTILISHPNSAPSGFLVEVHRKARPRSELRAQALAMAADPALERTARWNLLEFTQEVYLRRAYGMILQWHGTFLEPKDQVPALKLRAVLDSL